MNTSTFTKYLRSIEDNPDLYLDKIEFFSNDGDGNCNNCYRK